MQKWIPFYISKLHTSVQYGTFLNLHLDKKKRIKNVVKTKFFPKCLYLQQSLFLEAWMIWRRDRERENLVLKFAFFGSFFGICLGILKCFRSKEVYVIIMLGAFFNVLFFSSLYEQYHHYISILKVCLLCM